MMRSPPRCSLALVACTAIGGCTPDEDPPEPDVPADVDYCASVRDWDPEWAAFEEQVVVLLNERRAEGQLCGDKPFGAADPLTMNPALRCAARKHALDMAEQDYFSNVDADELDFAQRAALAEYEGVPLEQNIGAAHSTPEQLVEAVMGSEGLCAHVMEQDADEIGMGYLEYEGASFPSYWTQVFGQAN